MGAIPTTKKRASSEAARLNLLAVAVVVCLTEHASAAISITCGRVRKTCRAACLCAAVLQRDNFSAQLLYLLCPYRSHDIKRWLM